MVWGIQEMKASDWWFCVLMAIVSPFIWVGIVIGLVWVGLKIGFRLIDYRLMGYVLDE
jgi:hypothetical protein